MGKRKYKHLSPEDAAKAALNELLKEIDTMKANYATKMDEFRTDATKQSYYVSGVAGWISVMRTPEVRDIVSKAIQKAKSLFKGVRRPATTGAA